MDRKTMISNYIDNVYKELDEKREQPAVPAGGGLAAKPVKPVVEEDDTEERQGIVSRVGNMLSSYFKSDDDDTTIAMTTSPVTLDNAAKQAALNDLSIVDIIRANRDTPKDSGLINIPRKAPKKPEVRINVQEILSRFTPPTLPDAPTPTPSAPGGESTDGKVGEGLMLRPKARPDTIKPIPYYTLSNSEVEMIEKVVQREAGNQGIKGRNAVRGVILNRLAANEFPDTVQKVLEQKNQFEPVGKVGGKVDNITVSKKILKRNIAEFKKYLKEGEDASKGSTFFLNKQITQKRGTDFFGKNALEIGDHTFYSSYKNNPVVDVPTTSHNLKLESD